MGQVNNKKNVPRRTMEERFSVNQFLHHVDDSTSLLEAMYIFGAKMLIFSLEAGPQKKKKQNTNAIFFFRVYASGLFPYRIETARGRDWASRHVHTAFLCEQAAISYSFVPVNKNNVSNSALHCH